MTKVIVWIDDDIDLLTPLVEPLRKADYSILEFRTGEQTLSAIDELKETIEAALRH